MPTRLPMLVPAVALGGLVAALAAVGQSPTPGLYTHRDSFSGRQTAWAAADASVTYQEKDHRIVEDRYFNAPSSEYLKIEAKPATAGGDAEFVHYAYPTPPAPIGDTTALGVRVRAFRAGVQLRARVVLPKERDPKNPDAAFTTYLNGPTYGEEKVRLWDQLRITDAADLLRKQLPVLTARLGHQADPAGAYIDKLVLNVYAGPGVTEVWIDDLEIGPCRPDPKNPGGARTVGRTKPAAHPYSVEFGGGKLLVDGKPFFMRAIRHTDTGSEGLQRLREAKFNTVYLPADADPGTIAEAVEKHQFMIVPGVPLVGAESPVGTADREADRVAEHFRRFRSGDGVLLWSLGDGRRIEDLKSVSRTAEVLRSYDPRRPRAVDLWDGYQYYSEYLDVIGSHRWPLFTSLELEQYRFWLHQKRLLTAPGKLQWTWVQTHMPDWYVNLATGQTNPAQLDSPLGPTPEQIRLLTYLSLGAGCRGLGFWSDRYLANSHFGRDRLIELFLLNCEMELLEPVLFGVQDERTEWIKTSHPAVKAAVLRGRKGIIVLPVWVGDGSQFCVPQAAFPELKINVEEVPEGADPWLLTPASYTNLRNTGGVKQVPPGVEITIPQFDLTAAIVFTNDTAPDGLVVRWQENIRHQFGPIAARYAKEQAEEEYNKVFDVHQKLVEVGPQMVGADELFKESRQYLRKAQLYIENNQPDAAYREARRATRPLRVLMRDHWAAATKSLDQPTASPYAVSFFTLPQHWDLARRMQAAQPGANRLPHGGFELGGPIPKGGARVESLPGWTVRQTTIDPVQLRAAIDDAADVKEDDRPEPPKPPAPSGVRMDRYSSERIESARRGQELPVPDLGKHVLTLDVRPKEVPKKPEDLLPTAVKPKPGPIIGALERTFLAVDSPPVEFPPGTWVRCSFWVKLGRVISADGVMVYDSAGGEPLAMRVLGTTDYSTKPPTVRWKQYHFYRQVPPEGKIALTFAINGLGRVAFDDVRIEPMLPR